LSDDEPFTTHENAPHRRRNGNTSKEKIVCWLALPAGLGHETGDTLLHLRTLALRTGDLGLAVLGDTLDDREFLVAGLAFILVCGHIPPPLVSSVSDETSTKLFCYLKEPGYNVKQ
jgi:hypothetical protein